MITFLVALGALQSGLRISSIKALPDPPQMRRLQESRVQGGTGTGYSVGYVFGTFKGDLKNFAEVWTPDDKAVMLPMPRGATHATLSGVNSNGLAVGQYQAKRGEQLLVWDAATGKVQTPHLGERGSGYGVNDSGVIVGVHMARAGGRFIAFRYRDGKLQELKPIEPLKSSVAMAVNEEGVAVGNSFTDSRRATLWEADGDAKAIPLLEGTTVSEAAAINDKGIVVGTCSNADGSAGRGFFYGPDGLAEMAGLGVGCSPLSINNHNQVVGNARLTADAFENVGFVNWDGKSVDLNTLLHPDSGWKITEATHITDDGRVFGNGYLNGSRRAFMLQLSTSAEVAATPPANTVDVLRTSFLTAFNRGDATAIRARSSQAELK